MFGVLRYSPIHTKQTHLTIYYSSSSSSFCFSSSRSPSTHSLHTPTVRDHFCSTCFFLSKDSHCTVVATQTLLFCFCSFLWPRCKLCHKFNTPKQYFDCQSRKLDSDQVISCCEVHQELCFGF